MTVYVDDMRAAFGRMIMCHMIADTPVELHAMADRIGVARRWHQRDHYDSLSKRAMAVTAGAAEITWRDCGLMTMLQRHDPAAWLISPESRTLIEARIASPEQATIGNLPQEAAPVALPAAFDGAADLRRHWIIGRPTRAG